MRKTFGNLFCGVLVVFLSHMGCSALRVSPAPSTKFLEHPELLKPWEERLGWDAVWSESPGKILVKSDQKRKIYVAPVNTQYLNQEVKSKRISRVSTTDSQAMADFIRQSFVKTISDRSDSNLALASNEAEAGLVVEIALIELIPTEVGGNVLGNVSGLLIPGGKVIEEAASVGVQAGAGSLSAGSIAIELKIRDRRKRRVVVEAKDREADPLTVLPNVRDFESYGWSRRAVNEWADQFVKLFETSADIKIKSAPNVSILPW